MGLRMKKHFEHFWGSLKILIFRGEGGGGNSQKTNTDGGLPKKGGRARTVCRFKGMLMQISKSPFMFVLI